MKKRLIAVAASTIVAAVLASCGANKKLVRENEGLASNLEAERRRVAELEDRIGEKEREIRVLQVAITVREEELYALRTELAESRREKKDLESRIESVRREMDSLRGSAQSRSEVQARNLAAIRRELGDVERKSAELEARAAELEASLRRLNEELSGLRAERDELSRMLRGAGAEKDEMARKMEATYEGLLSSLRGEIDQKTVEIQRYRNALTINIMNHIFFDSGKAEIRKEGYDVLDRIASIVKTLPEKIVKIEGHTDDVPIGPKLKAKYPTNWELGAARASAVARYFTGTHGVDPARVVTVSYAFYRPLVPNTSAENRAKNRRIEIVLTDRELYELMEVADEP